ncbi:Glycosyltransferase [Zostera marina]|uniref:Hexosyltransferase n=1 Tax=Zostera marina TaxID=29655 RepID=A0A0K9Q586_ZOSMR|nr:Glycosyltransferase [Zostera marina]
MNGGINKVVGGGGGHRNNATSDQLMNNNTTSSYRPSLFHTILAIALVLPFVFLLSTGITMTLSNDDDPTVDDCSDSSFSCLGRRFGPGILGLSDESTGIKDVYRILSEVNSGRLRNTSTAELMNQTAYAMFLSEVNEQQYDLRTFAERLEDTIELLEEKARKIRLDQIVNKHYAATSIPKGIHCLSMRLTKEYYASTSKAEARKELTPSDQVHHLSDNSKYHFVISSDNILAASVVVASVRKSFSIPEKVVFHIITDEKTHPGMHAWFALNPVFPSIIEVKGVHQFEWLTTQKLPVVETFENHNSVLNTKNNDSEAQSTPHQLGSSLQARNSKYTSILNHLRIYLPELFPRLNKVVFLDDDVVVQRDLLPLFNIDLQGKVNGAVETCRGKDERVMSKRFSTYFNFTHPLISRYLNPRECAWAYGMNIFDLSTWRTTNIQHTYHYWINENQKSNFSLWILGTLPPGLLAFRGHVHPIEPVWHLLGLGYQENTDLDVVRDAAVIHYNGQSKPWLGIAFKHLQPFWTKHVNYQNQFIKSCGIFE